MSASSPAKPRIPSTSEIAAILRLPGAQVTATWLPSLITPRIRTAAKKMLLQGVANGYGSAAHIARQIAKHVGLTIDEQGNRNYWIPALSKELQPQAEALINAHFTARLLRGNGSGNSWKQQYAEQERTRALASIATGSRTSVGLYYSPLPVSTRDMWDRTFEKIAPISADELQRRKQACALLDGSTPVGLVF